MQKHQHKMGLWMLTALVAGNMVGSGMFLLPANLAALGSITIFSWIFTSLGAICLALVFSRLSSWLPKTGGPYAYVYNAFGDFIGFQTALCYWLALLIGDAGIALAAVGYLRFFVPQLANPILGSLVAIALVWFFVIISLFGARRTGHVQILATVLKFAPVLIIIICGWFYFHPEYLTTAFNISGKSNFAALSIGASLTFWGFIGLESATIPAMAVERPERNIPLATILGVLLAALIYILSSAVLMGMIPMRELAVATSPFALAATKIFGKFGGFIVALSAIFACLGSLNGWISLQGYIPMAAAEDGFFPKIFMRCNKRGVPYVGLLAASTFVSAVLLITAQANLVGQFQVLVLMTVFVTLITYFYATIAKIIMLKKRGAVLNCKNILQIVIAILGAIYALWVLFNAGHEIVFYGVILLFATVPLYAFVYWRRGTVS